MIIAEGQAALRLLALSYPFGGAAIMIAAYFQSVSKPKEALMITMGGVLLVKLAVLLLPCSLFAIIRNWASEAILELIHCLATLFMLKRYQQMMFAMEPLVYSSKAAAYHKEKTSCFYFLTGGVFFFASVFWRSVHLA
jgi:Na+-driven multidrug efflux pump